MANEAIVSFKGQLTERDFRRAQDLMLRKVRMLFGLPLVLVVVILLFGKYYPGGGKDPLVLAIVWTPLIVVMPLLWIVNRAFLGRYWRQNKLLGQPFAGAVSEQGIEWTTENSHSTLPWTGMRKLLNDDAIVVIGGGSQSFWIPRSAIVADADWAKFRALVKERLSP